MLDIQILRIVLTGFFLNPILRTTIKSNGAPAYHIVEMQYVSRVIFVVRWNVHVAFNFVSVAYPKHTHLVHARCGSFGQENARMSLKR